MQACSRENGGARRGGTEEGGEEGGREDRKEPREGRKDETV